MSGCNMTDSKIGNIQLRMWMDRWSFGMRELKRNALDIQCLNKWKNVLGHLKAPFYGGPLYKTATVYFRPANVGPYYARDEKITPIKAGVRRADKKVTFACDLGYGVLVFFIIEGFYFFRKSYISKICTLKSSDEIN